MKLFSTLAAIAATYVATMGSAFALPNPVPLPEPGTGLLVGLAVAGLAYVAKRGRK